jgi:predicted dehydrogenase
MEQWDKKLAVYKHSIWQDNGQWASTTEEPTYIKIAQGMPLTRECQSFIESIQTRIQPKTDGEEAIRVLRILTAGTVAHDKVR